MITKCSHFLLRWYTTIAHTKLNFESTYIQLVPPLELFQFFFAASPLFQFCGQAAVFAAAEKKRYVIVNTTKLSVSLFIELYTYQNFNTRSLDAN